MMLIELFVLESILGWGFLCVCNIGNFLLVLVNILGLFVSNWLIDVILIFFSYCLK